MVKMHEIVKVLEMVKMLKMPKRLQWFKMLKVVIYSVEQSYVNVSRFALSLNLLLNPLLESRC